MVAFKGFCCLILCCSVLIPLYETSPLVKRSLSKDNVQKTKPGKVDVHKSHNHTGKTVKISKPVYPQSNTSKIETGIESVDDNSTARIIDLSFLYYLLRENTSNSFPEMKELTTESRSINVNETDGLDTGNFSESGLKLYYMSDERKLNDTTIKENTSTVHSTGNITGDGLVHTDLSAGNQNASTDPPFQNNSAFVTSTNESKGANYRHHVTIPSQDVPRETTLETVSAEVLRNESNLHNISNLSGDYRNFKSNTGEQNFSVDGTDQTMNSTKTTKAQNEQLSAIAGTKLPKFTSILSNISDASMNINPQNTSDHSAKMKNESGTTDTGLMLRQHDITNEQTSAHNRSDIGKSYELSSNNKTQRNNESMDVLGGSVNPSGVLTENRNDTRQAAEDEATSKTNLQLVSHNHGANSSLADSEPLAHNKGPQQNESQKTALISSIVEAYVPEKVNGTPEGQLSNTLKTNLTTISQTPGEISELETPEPTVISKRQPYTSKKTPMSQTPEESKFGGTKPHATAVGQLDAISTPDSIVLIF